MSITPLLQKYFKGECTEAEQQVVERYLAGDATPELDALLLQTWDESDEKIKKMPARVNSWWNVAAAVVLLITGAAVWWQLGSSRHLKGPVAATLWDTLSNKGNELQRYHLPDGSVVWLNAYSQIVYNDGYGEHNRELWLNGEGYFEVAQQAVHPFMVHTRGITTTALGTTFNIAMANRADSAIEVSLLSGRVAVSDHLAKPAFRKELIPGQMLVYYPDKTPAVKPFLESEITDWKNGKLIFDKVSMADAFAKIQQRYGCRIVMEDSILAKKKISGSFSSSQSLEQIMTTLQYVHDFNYTQLNKNTYVIKKHL